MTKTYRIKSRTRFTCFVTLTIILITILANFALWLQHSQQPDRTAV